MTAEAKRQKNRDQEGILHGHLLLRGLVVPLPHDKETIVGRDNEQSDVALMDERISRRHAGIVFEKGRYYIQDKDSTNGVVVNGKKIRAKTALSVNDIIELGPYSAVFVGNNHPQVHKSGRDRAESPEKVQSTLFSGHLSVVSLPDVIQLLNSIRKSGVLKITRRGNKKESTIGFDEGEITSAHHEHFTGEDAFYQILAISAGDFRFLPGKPPPVDEPMTRNTMSLLLEGSRRIDEGERESASETLSSPPTRKLPKMPG